jgi:alkylhydroperoxidase family enzyme
MKEPIPMPRIPYQPSDIAEPQALVDAVRKRRGGELINLDRMLLHSPPFAAGWNAFFHEVRTELALQPKLRELAMCVPAVLNRAEYEFHHHAPEFIKAGGTQAQVEALRQLDPPHPLPSGDLFDASERAAIQFAIEMTRNVHVSDSTFAAVQDALPDHQHIVELVGVIATYSTFHAMLDKQAQPLTAYVVSTYCNRLHMKNLRIF